MIFQIQHKQIINIKIGDCFFLNNSEEVDTHIVCRLTQSSNESLSIVVRKLLLRSLKKNICIVWRILEFSVHGCIQQLIDLS